MRSLLCCWKQKVEDEAHDLNWGEREEVLRERAHTVRLNASEMDPLQYREKSTSFLEQSSAQIEQPGSNGTEYSLVDVDQQNASVVTLASLNINSIPEEKLKNSKIETRNSSVSSNKTDKEFGTCSDSLQRSPMTLSPEIESGLSSPSNKTAPSSLAPATDSIIEDNSIKFSPGASEASPETSYVPKATSSPKTSPRGPVTPSPNCKNRLPSVVTPSAEGRKCNIPPPPASLSLYVTSAKGSYLVTPSPSMTTSLEDAPQLGLPSSPLSHRSSYNPVYRLKFGSMSEELDSTNTSKDEKMAT